MADKKKILAVDDENDVLLILRTALRDDFDMYTASSGPEALEIVEEIAPDAIILDMMMPQMDGMEVLVELRQRDATASTPVIFLTGVSDKKKVREALDKGTAYYLTKPFNHHELLTKVNMALDEAESGFAGG